MAGPGGDLGRILCTHKEVDKAAFTGSTEVGRAVMSLAVDGGLFGAFLHGGQVCESGARLLVHSRIYDEFLDRLKQRASGIRLGYQLEARTQMCPLVSEVQRRTTES
ncbi:MAG: aldehyde dehydrogenase family protein [Pseudomonadota bacterium]